MKNLAFILSVLFISLHVYPQEGWKSFSFTEAGGIFCASSELNRPDDFSFGKYSPRNLLDHDLSTTWAEGEKGDGTGTYVCLALPHSLPVTISFANGYQKNHNLFLANNRIKTIKLTLYAGFFNDMTITQQGFDAEAIAFPETKTLTLRDTEGIQSFPFPFDAEDVNIFRGSMLKEYVHSHQGSLLQQHNYSSLKDFIFIKAEIISVYKGNKWDDTCLSELSFSEHTKKKHIPPDVKITGLEEKEDRILVNTTKGQYTLVTADAEGMVLSIMDETPDHEWAIIDVMTGGTGRRTEETYRLYNVRLLQAVSPRTIAKWGMGEPYGFAVKDGKNYVELDEGRMLLEDIGEDMQKNDKDGDPVRNDGLKALTYLFAEAIYTRDIPALLSCMDKQYLKEQLTGFMQGDTLMFLNDQFSGPLQTEKGMASVPFNKIDAINDPVTEPATENSWKLYLNITGENKTIRCFWTIIRKDSEAGMPVYVISGAVG